MSATAEKEAKRTSLPPFGIEACHPRNCDLLVQHPGKAEALCRLRSAFNPVVTNVQGQTVPLQKSEGGVPPATPGQQIHVDPSKGIYMVVDPLDKDDVLLDKMQSYMKRNGIQTAGRLRGVPPVEGRLDPHEMKTLIRQLLTMVANGHAKECKGILPDMEDVEAMPGWFLQAKGSSNQPRYEKDMPQFVERLQSSV